ncbi:MAG: hypothetical protein JRI68_11010 [Deltaproteobacteria bacterium]|nr:hypothetical protein [Deltaproteobacteria bacterium]
MAKFCGNHTVPMTRPEDRALLGGVAALATAIVLLELLSFRLCAATLGGSFATFVGLMSPFAAALGAVTLGRRSAAVSPARLAKSAAYWAVLAGATTVVGTVALSWASQGVARQGGEGDLLHVWVVLAGWLLPAWLSGGALATAVRCGLRTIGRLGFAEALGGVVACLLVPAAMWVGAPRAALICGALYAAAAFCFGYVGRAARPRWPALATLPLVVLVLVSGDIGAPWLKMRVTEGRRTKVELWVWTAAGVITVDKVVRRHTRYRIDRSRAVPIAKRDNNKRKPRYHVQDAVYDLRGRVQGPVLLIGASGGRDVRVALAYDNERVDWVVPHVALLQDVLRDRYGEHTGDLLADDRIRTWIGDGRAALASLPQGYANVVVLDTGDGAQTAPRQVTYQDRRFTTEAVRDYLGRLSDQGALLLHSSVTALPSLMATVVEAVGEPAEKTRKRMFACVNGAGVAALLVNWKSIDPVTARALSKGCKKARRFVAYPLPEIRTKSPGRKLAERDRSERMARLEGGTAVFDERPLLSPPTPLGELPRVAMTALRGLRPQAEDKKDKKPSSSPPSDTEAAVPWESASDLVRDKLSQGGIAAAATAMGLLALIVTLLVPAAQPGVGRRSAPVPLRLSFPLFGLALALGLFVLVERFTRLLGDGAYAWSVLIPLGLAAVGGGRLWVDALEQPRARRTTMILLGAGAAWLLVLAAAAEPLLRATSSSTVLALLVVLVVTLITGALLGAPLALGLVVVRAHGPAQSTWCWGAHHAGWAFGAALAASLVHAVGLRPLLPIAVAAYALGAALFVLGSRGGAPRVESSAPSGPSAAPDPRGAATAAAPGDGSAAPPQPAA